MNLHRCIKMGVPDSKVVEWNGLMFVGEAPGADEEEIGLPFVGKAGKQFNGWLLEAGINRYASVITNVFHIRPENNKVELFFTPLLKEAAPGYEKYKHNGRWLRHELAKEIVRLRSEIQLINPNAIVALGAVAMWALTGKQGITAFHGNTIEIAGLPPVIPVFHPAYLDRSPNPTYRQWVITALTMVREKYCN